MAIIGHCDPFGSAEYTRLTRRHLGGHIAGCAQEEDIPHEEEAQADGRKSTEGRDCSEQVPGLWAHQEDAHFVSSLYGQYVLPFQLHKRP
jgi:hypothetical protein